MEIVKHSEETKRPVQPANETTLITLDDQPGRQASSNGKSYLFFSGYAYLGMHAVPEFQALIKEGIEKFGWNYPSSRISNTPLGLYEQFEEKLSALTGFQHTITTASGYAAGQMALQLLKHKADFMIAPGTHPAVCEGMAQYKGSFENWTELVITTLNTKQKHSISAIVADAVNPLTGTINDLSFLQFIDKKCICIIDDSHGIGLIGEDGKGISSLLPSNKNLDILLVYSLSKAFNLNGGAISTNNAGFAKQLQQLPAYTASTPLSPALLYGFMEGEKLYGQQLKKLQKNISFFSDCVKSKKTIVHPTPSLPIFVFKKQVDENAFMEQGVLISSFAYPDPKGKKTQRIVINALHTEDDLQYLASIIE
jgi:8-amino-7-oxononanoate synthase